VTAASTAATENIGEPWLRIDGNIFVVGKDQQILEAICARGARSFGVMRL
jgi:hypothetical protein